VNQQIQASEANDQELLFLRKSCFVFCVVSLLMFDRGGTPESIE